MLRRLIARNQRSWMEAVAGATGGSVGAGGVKAAELDVETMALNAEFTPLYESLGYRSLGTGRTWWLHLSGRRSSAAAPDRPS